MGVIKDFHRISDVTAQGDILTEEESREISRLFPKYIFYRKGRSSVELWASCCGRHEEIQTGGRVRKPVPIDLCHSYQTSCPWCGESVHVMCCGRFRTGATLEKISRVVTLRTDGTYLYAVAFVCGVEYYDMKLHRPLWVRPLQMYRFAPGEALEADTQRTDMENNPWLYQERIELRTSRKYVQEPFLHGSISFYQHSGYYVIGAEALADSPFRYCGYFTHWHTEETTEPCKDLISYLTASAVYPRQVEMLSKFGIREPVETLMREHGKSSPLIDFYAPDPRQAFGLDREGLRDFIKNSRDIKVLPAYRKLCENGLRTPFSKLDWFYNNIGSVWLDRTVERLCRHSIRLERLERYLDREKKAAGGVFADTVWYELWVDYVDAAEALGMDLSNEVFLFPRGLPGKHDEVTGTLAALNEMRVRKEMREIECPRMQELNARYMYWDDRWLIRAPVGASEIVTEGKILKHCVGGYANRHVEGKVVILFLRDKLRPGKPLVTIEMRETKIVQIHGYKDDRQPCPENPNCASPREIYREFLDGWLAWLDAGSRRDKNGCPICTKCTKETAA